MEKSSQSWFGRPSLHTDQQKDEFWIYSPYGGNWFEKELNYKFYRPAHGRKEIELNDLLDEWSKKKKATTTKGRYIQVEPAGSNSEPSQIQEPIKLKLIISVFCWDWNDPALSEEKKSDPSLSEEEKKKKKEVKSVINDLVSLVTSEGSWLIFHGTKREDSSKKGMATKKREEDFAMLGNVMKYHRGASVVAVGLGNIEGQERNKLSKDMVVNEWVENYIISEDVFDIRGQKNRSEDEGFECSVVISGSKQQVMTVIKNSVNKGRPVILVKGLGKDVDYLAALVEKEKVKQNDKNTTSRSISNGTSKDNNEMKELDLVNNPGKLNLLCIYGIKSDVQGKTANGQGQPKKDSKKTNSQAQPKRDSKVTESQVQDTEDSKKTNRESIKEKVLDALANCLPAGGKDRDKRNLLLKKCIEWNEFHLAKKKELFPTTPKDMVSSCAEQKCVKETLAAAFEWRREKFIEKILEKDLHKGMDITVDDVESWYSKYHKNGPKRRGNKKHKSIGDAIKELIPSFSFTLSTSDEKRLGNCCLRSCREKPGEENQSWSEENQSGSEENLSRRNIFILVLLIDKPKLLKLGTFLNHENNNNTIIKHQAAAALFASGVLRAIAKAEGKYWHHYAIYKAKSLEFGKKAEEIIRNDYENSPTKTHLILRQRLADWGNMSLMHIAMETRNKAFFVLEPCHNILNKVWIWGDDADAEILLHTKDESQGKSGCKKYKELILSAFPPRVMYFFNLLAVLLFLMAFALLIVSKLETERFHWLEWIVLTTVITFLMQEIGQLSMKWKDAVEQNENKGLHLFKILKKVASTYTKDYFNIIDSSSIVIYFAAFTARVVGHYDSGNTKYMDAARVMFSVAFVVFTLRLLRFCYISEQLGPVVHMIIKMVKTMLQFLVILTIFFLAYAVASEAVLYPESKMSFALVFHVLRKAYWSMYGELFLDELEADGSDHCTQCTTDPNLYDEYDELRCASQTGRYIVPVFLGIYVLIVNILLLNLLIAKFSSVITKAEERSGALWSYQRAVMLKEFSRYILPFPFTPLSILLLCVRPNNDPFSYASEEDIGHFMDLQEMKNPAQDGDSKKRPYTQSQPKPVDPSEALKDFTLKMKELSESIREMKEAQKEKKEPEDVGTKLEELLGQVTSLQSATRGYNASTKDHLKSLEKLQREKDDSSKSFKDCSLCGENQQNLASTVEQLKSIENLLRKRDDSSKSCKECCVCDENKKKLESADNRLTKIEELLGQVTTSLHSATLGQEESAGVRTKIEELLGQVTSLQTAMRVQEASTEKQLKSIEDQLRERDDSSKSCKECCVCGENQKTLTSTEKQLKSIEDLLREKKDSSKSCKECCVCGENQKTLASTEKQLKLIENLLREKEDSSKSCKECCVCGENKQTLESAGVRLTNIEELLGQVKSLHSTTLGQEASTKEHLESIESLLREKEDSAKSCKECCVCGENQQTLASAEQQLKSIKKLLREKNDSSKSCKECCVCGENQQTLGALDRRMSKFEELLSRLERTSYRSPEPEYNPEPRPRNKPVRRSYPEPKDSLEERLARTSKLLSQRSPTRKAEPPAKVQHPQSWDSTVPKAEESPGRGSHTHFYKV